MEHWYSGAVVDAVREAKSRQALFIVYCRDDSEQSQSLDKLWLEFWSKFGSEDKIVALRLDKGSESCGQFTSIYKVQIYPTIYLINGQNGQVLKAVDRSIANSNELHELIQDSLSVREPKQQATTENPPSTGDGTAAAAPKSVDDRVAEARARLKELNDRREQEGKEKEIQAETERRRLGQQMLLDKQKKSEDLLRKQAEDIRREKAEQQKLQEKLKAQIQQDREDKRRKYEQEQMATAQAKVTTTVQKETPKSYTRARLQFRLTDGSFYTEDFPIDARINDVYAYLQETLPADQYKPGSYILRTAHTRASLARDNPGTLQELDLVPSAVLLVLNRPNGPSSPASSAFTSPLALANFNPNAIVQWISLAFTWMMMQLNVVYLYISSTVFGTRPTQQQTRSPNNPSVRRENRDNKNPQRSARTEKETSFKTDSSDKSNVRRFHNSQDDSDDEEKRTWNGNSTEQL